MTKTKTVQEETIHGSIEYEVIECDSCGQDVVEEQAKPFFILTGDSVTAWVDGEPITEKEEDEKFVIEACGAACPHCTETGPVGFPEEQKETEENPIMTGRELLIGLVSLLLGHLFGMVVLI